MVFDFTVLILLELYFLFVLVANFFSKVKFIHKNNYFICLVYFVLWTIIMYILTFKYAQFIKIVQTNTTL